MKKTLLFFIATAAMLALAVPVFAAGDAMKTDSEKESQSAAMGSESSQHMGMMTAEEIEGLEVYSQNGEELGEIEEVAIDEQSGKIRYVILSQGGILGIGDEEIPVAFEALRFEEDRAILTVDQSMLETAPKQTDVADDSQFQRDLQNHYGVSPAWDEDDKQQKDSTSMKDQGMDDDKETNLESDTGENQKKDY